MTMAERAPSPIGLDSIVDRYLAVWSEPDAERRRDAVAAVWAADGIEFVEGAQFRGREELTARVAEAYGEFVATGQYTVTCAGDITFHDNVVLFTIQLIAGTGPRAGQLAWAARVVLVVGEDGLVWQDYQLTLTPLQA